MGSRSRELGELTPHHGPILLPPGSVCLPGVRLPCRASLRRRRRVHPGILRILRQPHLQAIWLWSVGCGIKRVWLQHHGLQSQLFLWGLSLRRLSPIRNLFIVISNLKLKQKINDWQNCKKKNWENLKKKKKKKKKK